MQEQTGEARPAPMTVEELAGRIDYPLCEAGLSDGEIEEGCRLAVALGLGGVTVRGSNVDFAGRLLAGTGVRCGAVVDFPQGDAATSVKVYETRDLLRRGAGEIAVVVNTGKLRSRQFQYVEMELAQIGKAARESGARYRVIFEAGLLKEDERLIGLKIAKRAEAEVVELAGEAAEIEYFVRVLKGQAELECGGDGTVERVRAWGGLGVGRWREREPERLLAAWKGWLEEEARTSRSSPGSGSGIL